jgi:hypothetical protein
MWPDRRQTDTCAARGPETAFGEMTIRAEQTAENLHTARLRLLDPDFLGFYWCEGDCATVVRQGASHGSSALNFRMGDDPPGAAAKHYGVGERDPLSSLSGYRSIRTGPSHSIAEHPAHP